MIFYKSMQEIDIMRKSGRIVASVLDHLSSRVKPGLTTWDLEVLAIDHLNSNFPKAIPAFKGYMGYPTALCVSINEEVVHGIPSNKRIIKDGDLVSIDFGVFYEGYVGDAAISVIAGNASKEALDLLKVTKESLYEGIKQAKVGNYLHDISSAVQDYVETRGYSVVRELVGHGIGKSMHEAPQVPNFGEKGTGIILKPGLTIAVEPMVTSGSYDVEFLNDGWTAVTSDGSLAAHFEHSLAITSQGTIILTEL
ncbi:MAG: type I methionyl aminopeptidase [bacterium]